MALQIQVPDSPNSTQVVSLNAQNVTLNIRWNGIADAWSLDVLIGDLVLRTGITFQSDRDFTSHYIDMTKRLGGIFYCERASGDILTPLDRQSFNKGTHRIVFILN